MAAIAAMALLVWTPLLRIGLDLGDEGWLVEAALRMSAGEVLYRDVYRSYAPGFFAPFPPLFWWTEASLVSVRTVWLAALPVTCVVSYALARRVAPPWLALVAGVFPMLARAPIHKTFVPLAYAMALWLASRLAGRTHGPRALVALGSGFGLVALVRQEAGAWGLLIALATLALAPGRSATSWPSRIREGAWLAIGAAAVWLPLGLYWVSKGMLGDVIEQLVLLGARGNAANALPFPPLSAIVTGPGRAGTLLFYLPTASLAVGAMLLWQTLRERGNAAEAALISQWTAMALLSHSIFLSRTDAAHVTQALVAPILLYTAAGASALRSWRRDRAEPVHRAIGIPLALLAAAPLAVLPLAVDGIARLHAQRDAGVELGLPQAPVIVPAQQAREIRALVRAIHARVPPGEPIFVGPWSPGLYFLAERPNATRHGAVVPGFATQAVEQEIIDALEENEVPLAVTSVVRTRAGLRPDLAAFAPLLWGHVSKRYEREETIGSFALLRRRAAEEPPSDERP